ncbi:MAG: hypothetical protein AAFY20_01655 [Cyanobacteria bacterium J06639_14]
MTFINSEGPRVLEESSVLEPDRFAIPTSQPERDRLRHLIIGSPEGVRSAIHQLHVLKYAEQLAWSQLIVVPTSGLMITTQQGEVMSILRRDSWRSNL